MKDSDASNLVEGEWKKLNTLGYILNLHKVSPFLYLSYILYHHMVANGVKEIYECLLLPNYYCLKSVAAFLN